VVIQGKQKKDIVLLKFKRFDEMPQEEYKQYQKLTSTLTNMEGANLVTCDGAQRTSNIYALGWKASMFQLSNLNLKLL